jgi:polygalacturonase
MSTETRTFVIVAPAVFAAGGLSASAKIRNTLIGCMSHRDFLYLPAAMALAAIPVLRAQDTRNVTEPRFPQACVVLTARLSAEKGALSDASERTPDTARIQDAIDHCERGKAVELKSSGPSNIFLAGPLQLKPRVTLLVDGGAALCASRNPRDYDLAPGGCGIVTTGAGGCKPMITAWGVKIHTPKTARNTDGIDPSSSTNVTIVYCDIATGDDNVAIKTGLTPAAHMTIAHNHFYSGHGMSIGSGTSGGVSNIRVSDLTLDGTDNGIPIKSDRSRGGLVQDVSYENVCMRDVTNPVTVTSRNSFPAPLNSASYAVGFSSIGTSW